MSNVHDLVVIGGGPGGYTAALRAAQLGMNVGIIEKESKMGGTCLRVGCIPSKAMLESSQVYYDAKTSLAVHGVKATGVTLDLPTMLARKEQVVTTLAGGIDGLLKKAKITRYVGTGAFAGAGNVTVTNGKEQTQLTAKNFIIATGSKVAHLPTVKPDGDRVGTSTEALSYTDVPGHLVVIGGGYIGLEMSSVWRRLGAKVTVVEYLDRILPGIDLEIANEAHKIFKKQGFEFILGAKVLEAKSEKKQAVVRYEGGQITCDRVLLAVGRAPNTEGLGLETIGLKPEERGGKITIDDHFRTAAPGVYAIGDVVRGPMLAHKAEEEAVACADAIAGKYCHVNYDVIPAVVYTHPEIGTVGKTEEQLKEQGIAYNKGKFPFMANGRARTLNDTEGFVKILAAATDDRVLGVHIIGPRAGDLIAEAAAAMEFGASSEDMFRTCHSHPTLSEAVKEAALAVHKRTLSI
jgi:dihydrolipoamide dehydrogenase